MVAGRIGRVTLLRRLAAEGGIALAGRVFDLGRSGSHRNYVQLVEIGIDVTLNGDKTTFAAFEGIPVFDVPLRVQVGD